MSLPMRRLVTVPSHINSISSLYRRSFASRVSIRPTRTTSSTKFPLFFHSTGPFQILDSSLRFEEETLPQYKAENYYPVDLGDTYQGRYRVISKLGCGTKSTVWLCRDARTSHYVALKICTVSRNDTDIEPELIILRHLQSVKDELNVKSLVRLPLDDFQLHSDQDFRQCAREKVLPLDNVRMTVHVVLLALNFIHKAGVIHTDLSPNNLLLGVLDDSAFIEMEEVECIQPAPRKILPERVIYATQRPPLTGGLPVLCDFGNAKIGHRFSDDVMPSVYRAPEIILGTEWDCKIDVWSVAMMIWSMFEGHRLFRVIKDGMINDELHLAEMVSLMGPPPKSFLARSKKSHLYWDSEGNWIAATPIPQQTLETCEHRLQGTEKERHLRFVRRILCWDPEERPSALELAYDKWLTDSIPMTQDSTDQQETDQH